MQSSHSMLTSAVVAGPAAVHAKRHVMSCHVMSCH